MVQIAFGAGGDGIPLRLRHLRREEGVAHGEAAHRVAAAAGHRARTAHPMLFDGKAFDHRQQQRNAFVRICCVIGQRPCPAERFHPVGQIPPDRMADDACAVGKIASGRRKLFRIKRFRLQKTVGRADQFLCGGMALQLLFDFCGQRKKGLRTNGGRQAEAGDGNKADVHCTVRLLELLELLEKI